MPTYLKKTTAAKQVGSTGRAVVTAASRCFLNPAIPKDISAVRTAGLPLDGYNNYRCIAKNGGFVGSVNSVAARGHRGQADRRRCIQEAVVVADETRQLVAEYGVPGSEMYRIQRP
jgi:hypothetical protein